MIVATGKIQTEQLIKDLIVIAKGNNELHEKNPVYGKLIHGDGWGMAYLDKGKWKTIKSTQPIYQDEKIHELEHLNTKAIILHVRRATKGEIALENTQPFSYHADEGDFLFAHNGTILDEFHTDFTYVSGSSDSAKWFNKMLNCFKKNDFPKSFMLKNYTSANFIFVTPKKIMIGQNFNVNPKYSTMKLLKNDSSVVISSEILPTMKQENWRQLDNKTIIEINLDDY